MAVKLLEKKMDLESISGLRLFNYRWPIKNMDHFIHFQALLMIIYLLYMLSSDLRPVSTEIFQILKNPCLLNA
jgi:hypothetical protein